MIGSNQKLFTPKYSLYIFLPNIQGLGPGAFVTLSGLKVGVVGEISFTERNNQPGIRIELKINRNYRKRVTRSSSATIRTLGILGDKYVDLSIGKPDEPPLAAGDFVKCNLPLDTESLLKQANTTVSELNQTMLNIRQLSEEILAGEGTLGLLLRDDAARTNLAAVIRNLNILSSNLVAGHGTTGKLLQDPQLYDDLETSARNLALISDRLQNGEGSLGKMLVDTTLYDRLTSLSSSTDSLVRNIQGDGTTGKLIRDKQFYERLVSLAQALDALVTDIQENPKKYVTIKVF